MTSTLALSEGDLAIVQTILAQHLPAGVRVSVFGSRAGGDPKPWSDLDLALHCQSPMVFEPLPLALIAALAEAFDEAPLPWKVDLVDRGTVSEAFGRIIDQTAVPLPE